MRINLITGELLPARAKPPKSPEPGISYLDDVTELPSPSGKFVLQYEEEPVRRLVIKTSKVSKLGEISDSGETSIDQAFWGTTDASFIYITSTEKDGESVYDLYIYSTEERKSLLLAQDIVSGSGPMGMPRIRWFSNGRYLICMRRLPHEPKNLPSSGRLSNPGAVIILDPGKGAKPIRVFDRPVIGYLLSPSENRIAFIELAKDEYGDYENLSLNVADIRTGKINHLLTTRHMPAFIWAGEDALAVTTYDKFSVPTISLMNIDGRRTQLVSTKEYAQLEPLAYLPKYNRIVYKAADDTARFVDSELWSISPGKAPVRLLPRSGRK